MKTVEISYNPYKMITRILIDKVDVCQNDYYKKFRDFIEHKIPLQTWIEPIPYRDWNGFVYEISDPERNDEVTVVFSGRVIDFADLKRSITAQNEERSERARVIYHFKQKKVLDDKILAKNIEEVVNEIKSDRFSELVKQRTTDGLKEKYLALEENYTIAKQSEFFIVLTGVYSAGKSTLLNALIRHDILPTSSGTCTSKNCRIRHDADLGTKVSLCCFDEQGHVVIDKRVYDNDTECAKAFEEISPMKKKGVDEKYPNVSTLELGVDLSHLYPESVSDDTFTIVLIDTPGVDSAESSEYGHNRHAETALEAITMDSKPMIVLCVDALKYQDDSIGEFMKQILAASKEDDSGFNDRFLFLMNKGDDCSYKKGETPDDAREKFATYLTSPAKWNIQADENELKNLAHSASHFVPRIFMTAARVAFAIQRNAFDYSKDEMKDDPDKKDLNQKFRHLREQICDYEDTNYFLSRYCDIPNYRKAELEAQFATAMEEQDISQSHSTHMGI